MNSVLCDLHIASPPCEHNDILRPNGHLCRSLLCLPALFHKHLQCHIYTLLTLQSRPHHSVVSKCFGNWFLLKGKNKNFGDRSPQSMFWRMLWIFKIAALQPMHSSGISAYLTGALSDSLQVYQRRTL